MKKGSSWESIRMHTESSTHIHASMHTQATVAAVSSVLFFGFVGLLLDPKSFADMRCCLVGHPDDCYMVKAPPRRLRAS